MDTSSSVSGSLGCCMLPVTPPIRARDPSECSMSQLAQEGLSPAHLISQAVLALDGRGGTHTVTIHQHHQGRGSYCSLPRKLNRDGKETHGRRCRNSSLIMMFVLVFTAE